MAATLDPNNPGMMPHKVSAPIHYPNLAALNAKLRPEDSVDYITVADPVIHADGINKYTSYRVDCRPPPLHDPANNNINNNNNSQIIDTFLQNNQNQYSSVLRRYSDFLWLYDRLHKERAGAILPPLPEKQAVARFSPEFVQDRRRHLEKFLRRVILHPELNDANCLMTFLRADDVTFGHAKSVAEKMGNEEMSMVGSGGGLADGGSGMGGAGAFMTSPKNTAGLKKWFSEAKTSMSGDLVCSPDDDLFDEIERYIEALHIQMKRVSNQASGLVRKGREIANGMFEFGLAFHQLGLSEGEALGTKLDLVGGTADALSAMAAQHSEKERDHLEEPFKDYLKIIHAVKLALSRRHDKRVSYTALLHEIETRQVNLNRLRMTPGAEAKAYSTEMSLQRYQQAGEMAREEYAEVSQRVLREVDRFKREKAEEMRMVVMEFILLQIEVNRKMEGVWGELVPKLEGGVGDSRRGSGGVGDVAGSMASHPNNNMGGEGQGTRVHMPPSQPPPPIPPPSMPTQPMYSNVPAPVMGGSDPLMESSIQYRDNNFADMGL